MPNLKIYHFKEGTAELFELLKEHQIEFAEQLPPLGRIQASAGIVEILQAAALVAAPLSTVLVTWLNARTSRSASVQTSDGAIVQTKGMSQAETEKLLRTAITLSVIQTAKDTAPTPPEI